MRQSPAPVTKHTIRPPGLCRARRGGTLVFSGAANFTRTEATDVTAR